MGLNKIHTGGDFTKLTNLENVKRFISTLPHYEFRDIYINGTKLQNYKAICYSGTNKAVAIVSNRYKLVQHKTVFDIALEKIQEHYKDTEIKGWVEHTNTKAYIFLGMKQIDVEYDSNYNCGLLITNSVNTQLSVWINTFLYRLVCNNGLISRENVLAIQNKHLGANEFLNRFKERLETILKGFNDILKKEFRFLEELRSFTLTKKEVADKILINLDMSKKAYFTVLKQINDVDTLFNVYQALTNYYTNSRSLNIANRVQQIKKAREVINEYAKSITIRG